jgi:regulator of ribonuclease activity A
VEFTTADLCDAYPDLVHVVEPLFHEYGGATHFCGFIQTVQVHEDNALVRKILEGEGNGRVLVVDGGGSLNCALVGGNLAQLARSSGWSGILVNGCVRDRHELALVPLGIRALHTVPMRSAKAGAGSAGVTFSFAGVDFVPGKVLYADTDGILLADRPLTDSRR